MDEEFSIKEEIEDILNDYDYPITLEKDAVRSMMYDLMKVVHERLDSLINSDNDTLKNKAIGKNTKFAAQISKNNLILVKEMLKL